jgi:Na+/phosphate symporter
LEKKETQIAESTSAAITKAVDEVRQIVESLEQALQQMEEVLRLAEMAERQKITDEHEIESLRRALRRIQQPRSRQPEQPPTD